MEIKKVRGEDKGRIFIYALSTCGWCKKTKNLLNTLGLAYEYVDVDLLPDDDKKSVIQEIIKWNPDRSFPTIVINEKTCIVGFNEQKIREELGI